MLVFRRIAVVLTIAGASSQRGTSGSAEPLSLDSETLPHPGARRMSTLEYTRAR